MSSSSSTDSHHCHKKRKQSKRHHSKANSSLLREIRDKMQRISNRVTRIEGSTTGHDCSDNAAQSAAITGEPNRNQRPLVPTTDSPAEGQSNPISDTQHAGEDSPSTWGDCMEQDEQELPNYDETVFWELDQTPKTWIRKYKNSRPP